MPATHASKLKQTYAQIATGYETVQGENISVDDLNAFAKHIKRGGKILDLGCGHGRDSKWFADQGFQVTMFDLSPEMLEIAKHKVPEAIAIQGDMTDMNFEEASFDGIWASASILHLTKPEARQVLQDCYQILKKNGVMHCTLKKGEGEKEIIQNKYGQETKRFFAFYVLEEAENLFKKTGFKIINSKTNQYRSGQQGVQILGEKI